MTIDATKSPTPTWQRVLIGVLLAGVIVAVGYFLWTHELHHAKASSPPANPPAVAQTAHAPASHPRATPVTTIPGGLPISSRNPFSS
jgi:hypothetical protein